MSSELSVTMAKWVAQQEAIDEAVARAMKEDEEANQQEAELHADWQEAYNEALIKHRNERKDICNALANRDCMKEFRAYLVSVGRRRHATAEIKYLAEKQRAVVAGLYAYNGELRAGL